MMFGGAEAMSLINMISKKEHGFRLSPVKTPNQVKASREIGVSQFLPWSHLIDERTFVTHDGGIGSVIEVRGIAFEVSDDEVLAHYHQRLSAFWQSLPESIAIYVTQNRHLANSYPEGDFPEGFASDFNRAYQKTFENKALFVNDWYITLVVKNFVQQSNKKTRFFKKLFYDKQAAIRQQAQEKQYQLLKQCLQEAMVSLSEFSPNILGDRNKKSELLGFLGLLVNGDYQARSYPPFCAELNRYLPEKRISFGRRVMEWQGNHTKDHKFGAILSIKEYQHETHALGLRPLLSANFSLISTHIFLRKPKNQVVNAINIQLGHLCDANDAALSQQDALAAARDGVASDLVAFGEHQHTLLILADNQKTLDQHIAQVTSFYLDAGLIIVRESLNLESAFFSQMPGNFSYIRRKALVSSENLTDYVPLYNYHHGYVDRNHLGSAWMLIESQGRTPLYFNFHERGFGTKDNPPLGHALMIAPSGTGKTTLLCALDAQGKKYHGLSFFFDRDRGCEIYVRAMGGFYTAIKPGVSTGFNPLQLDDTPTNRAFLIHWFSSLLVGNGSLPEASVKHVEEIIHRNYTLPKSSRRLSIIADFLPIDFEFRDHLQPWLRSRDPERPDGALAYLFDNPEDTLDLSYQNVAGFDMTVLLSEQNKTVSPSVFLYLFHRLESLMTGRLMSLYLDEAWQFLNHPYWISKMEIFLLSKRKANVHLTFISQSADKILNSPLKSHLIENTATHIFLANDKADRKAYLEGLQLSEGEYQFIRHTGKASRCFLFRQGNEVAIGRLNLTGLEDFIRIFSANESSLRLCDKVRIEVGEDPKLWIPLFLERLRSLT